MRKAFAVPTVFISIILAAVLLIGGCATAGPPGPGQPEPYPTALNCATYGIGGAEYARFLAWSTEYEKDTGIKVRIYPREDGALRQADVKQGMCDIMSCGWVEFIPAMKAEGSNANFMGGPYQGRSILLATRMPFVFYVRGDSPIKSYKDITKDTRIAYYPRSSALVVYTDTLLAFAGLKKADVKLVEFGSYGDEATSLLENKADIAIASSNSAYLKQVAAGPSGVRVLEMNPAADPAGWERARKVAPLNAYGLIGQGQGIPEAVGKVSGISTGLYRTRATFNSDFVYDWTKWMFANREKLVSTLPAEFADMTIDASIEGLPQDISPVHDGAIRYYKEIGKWTAAMDAQNQAKIALMTTYVNAYENALKQAADQKLDATPTNKKWTDLWAGILKTLPPLVPPELK
ncbi:MAG: TAXI family TRAP transporter solute-binding subunit [Chloroflexota bacterium]